LRCLRFDGQDLLLHALVSLGERPPVPERGEAFDVVPLVSEDLPRAYHALLDPLVLFLREDDAEVEHRIAFGRRRIALLPHEVDARSSLHDLPHRAVRELRVPTPAIDLVTENQIAPSDPGHEGPDPIALLVLLVDRGLAFHEEHWLGEVLVLRVRRERVLLVLERRT